MIKTLSTMTGLISCFPKDFALNQFSLSLVSVSEFYTVVMKGILHMHQFLNVCHFI